MFFFWCSFIFGNVLSWLWRSKNLCFSFFLFTVKCLICVCMCMGVGAGVMFLELWKRKEARLRVKWGQTHFLEKVNVIKFKTKGCPMKKFINAIFFMLFFFFKRAVHRFFFYFSSGWVFFIFPPVTNKVKTRFVFCLNLSTPRNFAFLHARDIKGNLLTQLNSFPHFE